MKKYLLTAAISLFSAATFAQNFSGYCDLIVYQPFLKNYVAIPDYGTGNKKITKATNAIKDETGNIIKFPSEIKALNYMVKQGWELVSAYHNRGGETHFILKKVS